jgi:hypothetical protein
LPGQGRPATTTPGVGAAAPTTAPATHALSGTAHLLGLSSDQLSTALRAGATLSQLASHTGVPAHAVLRSVEHDLSIEAPGDGAALSDRQLAQIAVGVQSASQPTPLPPSRFDAYA